MIYCVSTPPTQGLLSSKLKRKFEKKHKRKVENIYYLEDIFPDTLVAAGLSKKGSFLWKVGRKIEKKTYEQNSIIVTVSDSCVQNIVDKGVPLNKIRIVNNWIDLSHTKYVSRASNTLFDEYRLSRNSFYAVYAGNLGLAQNVDLILDVAKTLLKFGDSIQFVLFGSGGEEKRLQSRIESENIVNVRLLPLQPTNRVPEVYSLGDIGIVTCKKGFGLSAMPSKTWSIMATERPVLASFDKDSDLCKLLLDKKAGLCSDADDVEEMADCVERLFKMKDNERYEMGKNGRDYVMNYRDKTACLDSFNSIFDELLNNSK